MSWNKKHWEAFHKPTLISMLCGEELVFLPKLTASISKVTQRLPGPTGVPTLTLWSCRTACGPFPRRNFCCAFSWGWGSETSCARWENRGVAPLISSDLELEQGQQGSQPHSQHHFSRSLTWKGLSLWKFILLNKQDLMFSHTYFCDHLVQTVFQFAGHIPTFYWGYKEHLQHLERLQIWLAVKDTLNIRIQVKIFEKYSWYVKWNT